MCASLHLDQIREAMAQACDYVRERILDGAGWRDPVSVAAAQLTLQAVADAVNLLAGPHALYRVEGVWVRPEQSCVGYQIGGHGG